jgi:hypothetical protein
LNSKKKALVTGASEGIGREFSKQLAAEGYQLTLVARNEARLRGLVEELGPEHNYEVADLSTDAGVEKTAARFQSNYDLLVNNAGFGVQGAFSETPIEKFIPMLRVNIDALVRLSHAYLKNARSGDALVNVASTLAFLPMPHAAIYCATKAFVTSLSESLWFEQKKRGVFVMDLCPGATSTEFQKRSGGREGDIPKAMLQTPDQVVRVAMDALRRRTKPTVISGIQNRMSATLARVLPRKVTVSIMGGMTQNS